MHYVEIFKILQKLKLKSKNHDVNYFFFFYVMMKTFIQQY